MNTSNRWVSLSGLINPAFGGGPGQVITRMQSLGYMDGSGEPTPEAFRVGLVRIVDGKRRFNKTRWLSICKRARQEANPAHGS